MIEDKIALCSADMQEVQVSGKITLEAQVRAYDLLESLLEDQEIAGDAACSSAAAGYVSVYEGVAHRLTGSFDAESLQLEMQSVLEPLRKEMNDARFEAAAAASLHEFAKDTFRTWQTAGIFARRRALRDLRERAGFRLESHRIGNYVAKTFDLMNEAQARFARAQQKLFAKDMSYKCRAEVYSRIYSLLSSHKN